jgi:branched-chain amino acid transport system ATP-binding protein
MAPHRRARIGLARTFQRLETFGTLSARDNVLVALESRHRRNRHDVDARRAADGLLERVGISQVAGERADTLPTGTARLLELARALATQPKLLLLDEPGSGLDAGESAALGRLLVELAHDGMAVLLVEHDVELVMRACADLHVLDFGRLIAAGTPAEIQQNPAVREAYLGAEVHEHHSEPAEVGR